MGVTLDTSTVRLGEMVELEDLRAAKLVELQAAADAAGQVSFAFDFGASPAVNDDGTPAGAAEVKHLQMRTGDPRHDDQGNWKAVLPVVLAGMMVGSTASIPLRVEENVTVLAQPTQVVQALTSAFARNSQIVVGTLPGLKLALDAAADAASVAAVTWPA